MVPYHRLFRKVAMFRIPIAPNLSIDAAEAELVAIHAQEAGARTSTRWVFR